MSKKFNKSFCSVYVKDRKHFLITPNGEHLPHLTKTITVCQEPSGFQSCTTTMLVNIVATKEEALELYKK